MTDRTLVLQAKHTIVKGLANSFKLLFPVVGGNISVLTVKDPSAQTYVYLYLNDSKVPKLYRSSWAIFL